MPTSMFFPSRINTESADKSNLAPLILDSISLRVTPKDGDRTTLGDRDTESPAICSSSFSSSFRPKTRRLYLYKSSSSEVAHSENPVVLNLFTASSRLFLTAEKQVHRSS